MARICYSYMFGGGAGTIMNLDELQVLEKNLEFWIYHIRSTKVRLQTKHDFVFSIKMKI